MNRRWITATALAAGLLFGATPSRADLLLVPEFNSNDVLLVNTTTGSKTVFASTGLDNPIGIDIGPNGQVYVANNGVSPALFNTVSRFSAQGAYLGSFGSDALSTPQGLTTDSAGNVYVANPVSGAPDTVEKFSPTGASLGSFVTEPTGSNPFAILFDKNTSVLDPNRGNFFKTDQNLDQVVEYSASGTLLRTIGSPVSAGGTLFRPDGLVLDSLGNLYVASSGNNAIVRFAVNPATGAFGTGVIVASNDTGANLFAPIGLLFGSNGNLLVSNYANARPNGGFIEEFTVNALTGSLTDLRTDVSGLNGPTFLVAAPTAVPEPGTVTMLATGAVVLLGYGWRRRRVPAVAGLTRRLVRAAAPAVRRPPVASGDMVDKQPPV